MDPLKASRAISLFLCCSLTSSLFAMEGKHIGKPNSFYDLIIETRKLDAEYTGIGIVVRKAKQGELIVSHVWVASPAEKSKLIKSGDRITHIYSKKDKGFLECWNLSLRHALQLIRGKAGTMARIKVERKDGSLKVIEIERAKIKVFSKTRLKFA